jgi:hypothetical protein
VTEPERPSSPAHLQAQIARVDADLAKARIRKERLERELEMAPYSAGCRQPANIGVTLADVKATIAELEARHDSLVAPPAVSPAVAVPGGALAKTPRRRP